MIKRFLVALTIMFPLLMMTPIVANAAYDPFGGVDCKQAVNSSVCHTNGSDPLTGTKGVLAKITNIISYVAGAAAIILILVGSLRYITSGGDPNSAKKAKDTVFYALIGIVVIVLARSFIIYVVLNVK